MTGRTWVFLVKVFIVTIFFMLYPVYYLTWPAFTFVGFSLYRGAAFLAALIAGFAVLAWHVRKWKKMPTGSPVLKGRNKADNALYLCLITLIPSFLVYLNLISIMAQYNSAYGHPYRSYVVIEKEEIKLSGSENPCDAYDYEIDRTVTYGIVMFAKICLSSTIYVAAKEFSVLEVSGLESVYGRSIDMKSVKMPLDPMFQSNWETILEKTHDEWTYYTDKKP